MALLALKAFHGTPKHNKITSKSKLLSGLVNVFSKKPLEGLNGDLINRFNRELDRFLLGEISLEQKKKEVPQTNADSEYPVIDVPCENNDDKDKPESTETVTNGIFSTLGISDEYRFFHLEIKYGNRL